MIQPARRLAPPDAPAYRKLMLEAYERHPDAFTSSAAERAALPLRFWEERLDPAADETVFGAFLDGALAGAAGLAFESREKVRHKARLFGMYVAPAARQHGIGRALVDAVLAHARDRGVVVVQLTVTDGNAAAISLYQRCGFTRFGLEPYAVAVGDRFVSKLHLWRKL